jgi:hypothetical protein
MSRKPPTFADAYLRRGHRPNMLVVALKGAVYFGGVLTFLSAVTIGAFANAPPEYLQPALICVPAGALLMVAGVWLIRHLLDAHALREAAQASNADRGAQPPLLPNRDTHSI